MSSPSPVDPARLTPRPTHVVVGEARPLVGDDQQHAAVRRPRRRVTSRPAPSGVCASTLPSRASRAASRSAALGAHRARVRAAARSVTSRPWSSASACQNSTRSATTARASQRASTPSRTGRRASRIRRVDLPGELVDVGLPAGRGPARRAGPRRPGAAPSPGSAAGATGRPPTRARGPAARRSGPPAGSAPCPTSRTSSGPSGTTRAERSPRPSRSAVTRQVGDRPGHRPGQPVGHHAGTRTNRVTASAASTRPGAPDAGVEHLLAHQGADHGGAVLAHHRLVEDHPAVVQHPHRGRPQVRLDRRRRGAERPADHARRTASGPAPRSCGRPPSPPLPRRRPRPRRRRSARSAGCGRSRS